MNGNIVLNFSLNYIKLSRVNQQLNFTLTNDQALILFEFLSRFNKVDYKEVFEDQSEEKVLWEIETQLEKVLSEPFFNNYTTILQDARSRIRDAE